MVNARLAAIAAPPLVVAALVIINAWPGLMPGVGFWDTGEFQTVLPIMGTAHPTGYPTYVLLGFLGNILLTPIGEPALRITALSLLAVATAAACTVLLVRRLTGSTIIGIGTGLGLATTPVVWINATRADPHPIHLAFVALLLLALVRWEHARREIGEQVADGEFIDAGGAIAGAARRVDRRLLLAAVLFGLAAGNHSLTLLLAPPIGLFVLSVEPTIWRRWRFVLACLGVAFGTVALVYLELPIRGGLVPASLIYGEPATWDGFWYIALAEQFRGSLSDPFAELAGKLDNLLEFSTAQLGVLTLAIPPAVLVAALRAPRYTLLTGVALVITIVFNEAYSNADIARYYMGPVLLVWTWIAILAAEVAQMAGLLVGGLLRARPFSVDHPTVRSASLVGAAIVAVVVLLPALGDLDARRQDADRSDDRYAAQWLDEALPAVPQGAVLVSWWSTSTPLWYAQKVQGLRPDIDIIDDRTMLDRHLGRAPDVIARFLGTRPVYVIRANDDDLGELTSQFDMTLVASGGSTGVWAVNGRLAATP
jgi:4-amino-4-deoxy-L-arabinose transferase-like glycosyltransferase